MGWLRSSKGRVVKVNIRVVKVNVRVVKVVTRYWWSYL